MLALEEEEEVSYGAREAMKDGAKSWEASPALKKQGKEIERLRQALEEGRPMSDRQKNRFQEAFKELQQRLRMPAVWKNSPKKSERK